MINKKIKVLVVDDHPLIVEGLKMGLENSTSIQVVDDANNGEQALAKLKSTEVDIVLLDIEMPVLNGIDAIGKIKEEFPKVKIIVLSTYSEKALISKLIKMQIDGFLSKASSESEIIKAIHTVNTVGSYFNSEAQIIMAKPDFGAEESDSWLVKPVNNSNLLAKLSNREVELFKLIVRGMTNKEISDSLFISAKTVGNHRTSIMNKLGIHNLAKLISFAYENKLIN